MNNTDFPPFPAPGARGQQVCEVVRLYLAIVNELPFAQVSILSEHIQTCKECSAEFHMIQRVTHMVATLPMSTPSAHVDRAILAAIQKRGETSHASVQLHAKNQEPLVRRLPTRKPTSHRRLISLALAAVLLLMLLAGVFFRGLIFSANNGQAFAIPKSLSWNGYILHYTQTKTDGQGQSYEVEVYQDLGTNQMHIESTMDGQFDVVVVTDAQSMVGEDMMHRVAQIGDGVAPWSVDGSMFDLAELRQDIATHKMNYLGIGTFQGQNVYMVRASDNEVLLLDMHYFPVNVLQNYNGPGSGLSLYKTFSLVPSAQVSDSMWDMTVPSGFQMGQLPAKS